MHWSVFDGSRVCVLNKNQMIETENTHHKGKYHCTADLLFDSFGFD